MQREKIKEMDPLVLEMLSEAMYPRARLRARES
jgi:hypothetical protein